MVKNGKWHFFCQQKLLNLYKQSLSVQTCTSLYRRDFLVHLWGLYRLVQTCTRHPWFADVGSNTNCIYVTLMGAWWSTGSAFTDEFYISRFVKPVYPVTTLCCSVASATCWSVFCRTLPIIQTIFRRWLPQVVLSHFGADLHQVSFIIYTVCCAWLWTERKRWLPRPHHAKVLGFVECQFRVSCYYGIGNLPVHTCSIGLCRCSWILTTPLVLLLPTWFPGTPFKRASVEYLQAGHEAKEIPLQCIKERMVSHYLTRSIEVQCTHLRPPTVRRTQNRLPDFDDRSALPYLDAVLRETLKWHPVFPMGLYTLLVFLSRFWWYSQVSHIQHQQVTSTTVISYQKIWTFLVYRRSLMIQKF